MAFMMRSIVTVFTLAKYPARLPTLITLAILLHTVSFPTFTSFSYILNLKPKTKHHRFLLEVLFLLLFNIETMRISPQRFNYRLLMPCHIFRMIPTVVTVTVLIAKYLLLKTFTIKFQALWSFAITSDFFLYSELIVLLVNWRHDWRVASFAMLRKWWWWVSYCVLYWKTLVDFLLEWLSEWLWIKRVLCLKYVMVVLWILSRTLVFHFRRNQTFIWAWTIQNFTKVLSLQKALLWFVCEFRKCLLRNNLAIFDLLYK